MIKIRQKGENSAEADIQRLYIFKRRILLKIFGPINDGNGLRIRSNNKVYDLFKSPDIINPINLKIRMGRACQEDRRV